MRTNSSPLLLLKGGTVLCHDDDDHVVPRFDTDILVRGTDIAEIGQNLQVPEPTATTSTTVIDCSRKIVSPGFVDTHHHLWQTQLKGRHADQTLLDYMPSGNLRSHAYTPDDVYWGQLGGCLEALDAGTTCVLDHNHSICSADHGSQALSATKASGLRSVLAYTIPMRFKSWTETECVPADDLLPDWAFQQLEAWLSQQTATDRVEIGLGFDFYFLPKDVVVGIFEKYRAAGVKVITSHAGKNAVMGTASLVNMLNDYGILGPDMVLSHANRLDSQEKALLKGSGGHVSSTPDTECQMGMGWPVALDPEVNGTLGIDCHSNNTSSILSQARSLLQMARQEQNVALLEQGRFPHTLRGSSERAFNLATIEGARALGMGNRTGSIRKGLRADLVVFDASTPSMTCVAKFDPLVAVLRHSDTREVDTVIVDGRVRKQAGKLLPVVLEDGTEVGWGDVAEKLAKSQDEVETRISRQSEGKARELLIQMWYIDESKIGS